MIDVAKEFEEANPAIRFIGADYDELKILDDAIFSLTLRHPGYGNDKKAHQLLKRVKLKLKEMENESEDKT